MAELEISIPYRNRLAQIGLGVTVLTFPFWGILPFMALCGIGAGVALATVTPIYSHHLGLQLGQLFFCLASIGIGLLTLLYFADNRITISKVGLCFPRNFLPLMQFKRQRAWNELRAVTCDNGELWNRKISNVATEPNVQPTTSWHCGRASMTCGTGNVRLKERNTKLPIRDLKLKFASGTSLTLNANGMSIENLNRLVLAIDVWASPYLIDTTQLDTIKRIARNNATPEALSYTAIWEEELGRRFHSTSYVPLEPGQLLKAGSIKVIRQLSFGGLSAIYLVQQKDKELLVLKEAVIPGYADEKSQKKAMELFEREANLLTKLDHPSISKVYDHFVEDGRHYLLLEYIQGHDLRLFVKHNGPQNENIVLDWTAQIASILSYLQAHQPPIVHRDLTPDNLVLRGTNEICLIDFGAANEFMSTATGTLVGKQAYIAPEQFRGKAQMVSDIYSLGCTMYFLLTGKDPEPLSVSHPKDAGIAISEGLDGLVAACTELDTTSRIGSAMEIRERIQQMRTNANSSQTAPVEQR